MTTASDAQSAEKSGQVSMSLRRPRPMHEAMKALAARRGSEAADLYVETVEAPCQSDLLTPFEMWRLVGG